MLSGSDHCLLLLGHPGRFQWLVLFLLAVLQGHASLHQLTLAQFGRVPEHRCRARLNATVGGSDLWPVVKQGTRQSYAPCLRFRDPANQRAGTQPCDQGWEYLAVDKGSSIVSEWDLVCERSLMRDLLCYVQPASSLLGALVVSALSDRVGRKPTLALAQGLQVAASVALLFAPSFLVFALLFALQTCCSVGSLLVSFVLMLETLPTPFHLHGACVLSLSCFLGYICLAVLTSVIATWRYVQLAISAPAIVSLAFLWLVPRSLPHLLLVGKLSMAEKSLSRMAHFSRVQLATSYKVLLQNAARGLHVSRVSPGGRHSFGELFLHKHIRRYLLTHLYLWAVISLFLKIKVSEISTLSEKRSVDLLTRGFLSLGLLLLAFVLARRLGTVRIQTVFLAFGGTVYVVAAFFEHRRAADDDGLSLDLFLSGLCGLFGWTAVNVARAVMFFDVAKSMPTGTRALGLGICTAVGNVCEMLAPSLSTLGGLLPFYLPMAGCGVLVLTAAGLSLVFPDAWHRPLPGTVEAADDAKATKPHRRAGSYSLPFGGGLGDFVYGGEDVHGPVVTTMRTKKGSRSGSETSCKRPLESMASSGTQQGGFGVQMAYPEKGSVFFQSCRVRDLHRATLAHATGSASSSDGDSETESRLTDLEDELNRAWELSAKGSRRSSKHQQQQQQQQQLQHDLQCFSPAQKHPRSSFSETAF
ncbi:solute carrier family 22 member 8-like [Ixodes scapularis]